MIRSIFGLSMLVFLMGCNTTKKTVVIEEEIFTEHRQLDTMVITAPAEIEDLVEENFQLPAYNASRTQYNDLLHTRLYLSFNWEKEQVMGKADLKLKPYFYATDQLTLDAKGFEIKSITMGGKALKYEYDGMLIDIQLDRTYTREENYELSIEYIATPRADGGSEAISSDKGLFFINPRGEEANKPQQIWTQGETENNSRWFPTIDSPNERCTQEIYVTVQDKYETLSNGLLLSSEKNDDGTRTDYWKMDMPHAPYLFMLTIGEFAVVEDEAWEGIPVNYYVEKEYEEHAKAIFPHTPEMLSFFSDVTGVKYPWQKYSQVVVRDYVSGAMENTTAVIFGEFMQYTERELIDELVNDKIVAHEMMHHWFGDYVTCENWANLTLNEGFANYSEYLWLEHKFGRDLADYHLLEEWEGYMASAAGGGMHPLIHYGYDDKEDMFDAHSYNKGGSILHMLRKHIGDDAFFTAFQKYLEDNALSAVEVDELRMAFEEVTGLDLHWFFNQWFHNQGHPALSIFYDYKDGEAIVHVEQTQNASLMPAIFELPTAIDIYMPGQDKPMRKEIRVNQREQTFRFPVSGQPALMIFDPERSILAEWDDQKTDEQLVYQFQHAPRFLDRYQALTEMSEAEMQKESILGQALKDDFFGIRLIALESINPYADLAASIKAQLYVLAEKDPHSEVRATALEFVAGLEGDTRALSIAKKAIDAEAYNVVAAGLSATYDLSKEEGLKAADKLKKSENESIISALGGIYNKEGDIEKLSYFETHLKDVDGYSALDFYDAYTELAGSTRKAAPLNRVIESLEGVGTDMGQSPWRRIAAMQSLSTIKNNVMEDAAKEGSELAPVLEKTKAAIANMKEKETNAQLKAIYEQF